MGSIDTYRDQLIAEGWRESTDAFWRDENPCFYDLSLIKTVLLFCGNGGAIDETRFFWKFESQPLPDFVNASHVEVRRYKLHHSMNALLWHDHGDRKILH